jgi:hypothetical protein
LSVSSSVSAAETICEVSNDQVDVHRELMAVVYPPSPLSPIVSLDHTFSVHKKTSAFLTPHCQLFPSQQAGGDICIREERSERNGLKRSFERMVNKQ